MKWYKFCYRRARQREKEAAVVKGPSPRYMGSRTKMKPDRELPELNNSEDRGKGCAVGTARGQLQESRVNRGGKCSFK